MENLSSMSEIVSLLQQLPDSIIRPYEQTFVTDRGSNRMTSLNWRNKFPEEMYPDLFRFHMGDMDILISALDLPGTLVFDGRYQSNRLYCQAQP